MRANVDKLLLRYTGVHGPVDVFSLAKHIGVNVHDYDIPEHGVVQFTHDIATVWLKSCDSLERKRFTLAHQIGHIVLHEPGVYRDVTFYGSDIERQANEYAHDILIPVGILQLAAPAMNHDTKRLARFFQVEPTVMLERLRRFYGM